MHIFSEYYGLKANLIGIPPSSTSPIRNIPSCAITKYFVNTQGNRKTPQITSDLLVPSVFINGGDRLATKEVISIMA